MPATPKKKSTLTYRELAALVKELPLEQKKKLLAILQESTSMKHFTSTTKEAPKQVKKYVQHAGLLIVEEDDMKYGVLANKKERENTAAIPEWQKQFVRKSIKKHKANPELLIAEKDAWRIIERGE